MSGYKHEKDRFPQRATVCFFIIISLFLCCVLRVGVITGDTEYLLMQNAQSSRRISVSRLRGTVYDCNLSPLTNNRSDIYLALTPSPNVTVAVSREFEGKEKEEILNKLKNKEYTVIKSEKRIKCDGIADTAVSYTDYDTFTAKHIIGYTDSSGHGVCGIEKAYDDILYSDKTADAVFSINGKGSMLNGVNPIFENDYSVTENGVVITIDKDIQQIAEDCAEGLNKGAIILCEVKTGKIRAMVSRPDYDINNLSEVLTKTDSPLINRALTAYPVGSVFKPCVAAAAIKYGNKGYCYYCTGRSLIIDRYFSCHEKSGHGFVNMTDALAFSCNTFFYNLGIKTGGEKIYNTATTLNFGNSIKIGKNIYTDSGNLTKPESLLNDALLANFSIGQGDLSLSPVALCDLYLCIADDGSYFTPSIIEGIKKGDNFIPYNRGNKTRVMEKGTADFLKNALRQVVLKGTGNGADSKIVETAGKTATAQTGRYYKNGAEINNSWFCGFFPFNKPQYVGVVMSEGESKETTSEIFRKLAEKVTEYS